MFAKILPVPTTGGVGCKIYPGAAPLDDFLIQYTQHVIQAVIIIKPMKQDSVIVLITQGVLLKKKTRIIAKSQLHMQNENSRDT